MAEARTRAETVLQLAMFMQARDARQWGVHTDGVYTPSWDDLGPVAQEEYTADAEVSVAAIDALGYVPRDAASEIASLTSRLAGAQRLGMSAIFLADALGEDDADIAAEQAAYDQKVASAALTAMADRLAEYTLDFSTPAATIEHITRLIRRDATLAAPGSFASQMFQYATEHGYTETHEWAQLTEDEKVFVNSLVKPAHDAVRYSKNILLEGTTAQEQPSTTALAADTETP